jgi:methyl-accepting chemotaxis protein
MSQTTSPNNAPLFDRMRFMQLDERGCELIRGLKTVVERELPVGLDKFYVRLRETPEVRKFFENETQISRAKGAQVAHWSTISSGKFDDRYIANVRAVGLTHARIGLEPRWYLGGYAIVLDHLIKMIVAEGWPTGWFNRRAKEGGEGLAEALGALVKAVILDMDCAISVYIEAGDARAKTVSDAQRLEQKMVTTAIGAGLSKLAAEDLTYRMTEDLPPAYRQLKDDFNSAMTQLETAMLSVNTSTRKIHSGAQEITVASDDLARRTEQQSASLEETAAALEQITATVNRTATGATHARKVVSKSKADAEKGGEIVRQAVAAMATIEKSSKEIAQIIGVIDEIAFQTNLLALNAGVEAARAGEAGRGFAVVASEVRALAQRSAEAAKEIKSLISASTAQVDEGVVLVKETGKALERIILQVSEINSVVTEIAASTQEQESGLQQVNKAVNQMDQVTQQNAAMVEHSTAACHLLTQEADQLTRLVGVFNLQKVPSHAFATAPKSAIGGAGSKTRVPVRRALQAGAKTAVNGGIGAPRGAGTNEGWEEF